MLSSRHVFLQKRCGVQWFLSNVIKNHWKRIRNIEKYKFGTRNITNIDHALEDKIKVVEQVLRKADFSFFTFSNKICNVDFGKAKTTSPVARLKVPPTTPGCD